MSAIFIIMPSYDLVRRVRLYAIFWDIFIFVAISRWWCWWYLLLASRRFPLAGIASRTKKAENAKRFIIYRPTLLIKAAPFIIFIYIFKHFHYLLLFYWAFLHSTTTFHQPTLFSRCYFRRLYISPRRCFRPQLVSASADDAGWLLALAFHYHYYWLPLFLLHILWHFRATMLCVSFWYSD